MPIVTTINKLSQVQPPASSEQLMERVCNKWLQRILQVLEAAGDGTMSYAEIREKLQPKSEKMFSNALKELEAYGFICLRKNKVKPEPRNYDYRLTEQGRSLLVVTNHLQDWATQSHENIVKNTIDWNRDRKENSEIGK